MASERPRAVARAPHGPRVVVVGSRFALAEENWRQPRPLHGAAFLVDSALSWLVARPEVVDVPDRPAMAAGMRVSEQGRAEVRRYVLVLMPLAALLLGAAVWSWRRSSEGKPYAVGAPRGHPTSPRREGRPSRPSGILIVLAVGTLAYAYVFDGEHVSDADRASRARRVFPMFDVADVRSLTFEQEGQRVALERGADGGEPRWMLRSPVNEPADPAAVDALLEDMNVAARVRDVGSAEVAAGLSSPRVRATVRVGSIEYAFELGAPAPVPEGAAYLHMSAGADGTFVVDRLLAEDLLRGADAYRDHVLVPYGRSETSRIEIRDLAGDAGTVVLTRAGPTFRVEGGLRASRDAVERLFAGLAEVRAGSFVREGEGGAAGAGSLLVALDPVSSARARVELRLGGACPDSPGQIVVRLAGPPARTACAPASALDAVRVAPEGIVDRGPFRAHADEVAELRLEPTGGTGAERAALESRPARKWLARALPRGP